MVGLIAGIIPRHKVVDLSLHFHLNWYTSLPRIGLGSTATWTHAYITSKTYLGKGELACSNSAREEITSLLSTTKYLKGLIEPSDIASKSSGQNKISSIPQEKLNAHTMIWEFVLFVGIALPVRTLTGLVGAGSIIHSQEGNLICDKNVMPIEIILENSKMSFGM